MGETQHELAVHKNIDECPDCGHAVHQDATLVYEHRGKVHDHRAKQRGETGKNGFQKHRGIISSGNVAVGGNMAKCLRKYLKTRHPHKPTKNVVLIRIRKR